jgi:uncharacterized phage-like protein YoqJ
MDATSQYTELIFLQQVMKSGDKIAKIEATNSEERIRFSQNNQYKVTITGKVLLFQKERGLSVRQLFINFRQHGFVNGA